MLSGLDLEKYLPGVNVIKYTDLENFKRIEDAIYSKGLIMLYPTKSSTVGHWCCCFKNKNIIYFFDSYGYIPDEQLNWATDNAKKDWDYDIYRRLTYLLHRSKCEIDYNPYKFQGPDSDVCGYWCLARLHNYNLNADQFKSLFKKVKGLELDDLVVAYVKNFLN